MVKPTTKLENSLFLNGYDTIIGADEVGIGCLAGPVVACAVKATKDFYILNNELLQRVRDSKLLTENMRTVLARELTHAAGLTHSITFSFPRTIDASNIYVVSRNALTRAIVPFVSQASAILIDGPRPLPRINAFQRAIVKGDRHIATIAAASIIAKVYRDAMMVRYAKKFPEYGFEKHKGYGTAYHVAQLTKHGPSPIHRYSFAPVANVV